MNFYWENQKLKNGYSAIIGCDEVGRGCLAGPVVAAAVVLPKIQNSNFKLQKWNQIKDSKLLSAGKREELSKMIKENSIAWSIGEVSSKIIDEINIHNATLLAMRKAADALPRKGKSFLYIDGKFTIPDFSLEQEAVVGGDNKILSIAAASIIAKVYRDELMRKLHQKYPIYNFAQHKGYGTMFHQTMIKQNGLSPMHRKSFCTRIIVDK